MDQHDAEIFDVPAIYSDRSLQVDAICTFLGCPASAAERVYDYGIRWLPYQSIQNPDPRAELDFALANFGSSSAHWLRDTWTGREVVPSDPYSVGDAREWHEGLAESPPLERGQFRVVPESTAPLNRAMSIRRRLVDIAAEREATLDFAMPVWRASNSDELQAVVATIRASLDSFSVGQRLWFRGQPREYQSARSADIADWLGLPKHDPSLVPSLARRKAFVAGVTPDSEYYLRRSRQSDWRMAFLSWVSQLPGYRPQDPDVRRQLDEMTYDLREKEGRATFDLQCSAGSEDLDGLRQWWFSGGTAPAVTLWLQHYGAATSALDVTASLDVGTYFARREWDAQERCFVDAGDTTGVIYVFSAAEQSDFISDSQTLGNPPIPIEPPARVQAQQCGLLGGANVHAKNRALDLTIAKIEIELAGFQHVPSDTFIYPGPDRDSLFSRLLRTSPELEGLARFGH